jgi:hypothetical protein
MTIRKVLLLTGYCCLLWIPTTVQSKQLPVAIDIQSPVEQGMLSKADFSTLLKSMIESYKLYGVLDPQYYRLRSDMRIALGKLGEARKLVTKAGLEFENLETQRSIALLEEAMGFFMAGAPYIQDVQELAKAYFLLAANYYLEGESKKSKDAIVLGVTLAPEVDPDPMVWNPDMMEFFKPIAMEAIHASTGNVLVRSEKKGAKVYLNGKHIGETPAKLRDIRAGYHILRVESPGHVNWGRRIQVVPGVEVRHRAKLTQVVAETSYLQLIDNALSAVQSANEFTPALNELIERNGANQTLLVKLEKTQETLYQIQFFLYDKLSQTMATKASMNLSNPPAEKELAAVKGYIEQNFKTFPSLCAARTAGQSQHHDLSTQAQQKIIQHLGEYGASVCFLGEAIAQSCYDDPACIKTKMVEFETSGVFLVGVEGADDYRELHVRYFENKSGSQFAHIQLPVISDRLQTNTATTAALENLILATRQTQFLSAAQLEAMRTSDQPQAEESVEEVAQPQPAAAPEPGRRDELHVVFETPQVAARDPVIKASPWGAILATALGVGVSVGSGLLLQEQLHTLNDKQSTGSEKEEAQILYQLTIGGVAMGAITSIVGSYFIFAD